MKKDAKIFIAGASGMVGSALVRNLLKKGYTNLVGSYHSKILSEQKSLPVKMVQIDLQNQEAVNRFFASEKPAHVFLAAAKVGGIQANNTYPAQFIYENLTIQANVIHAAYQSGVQRLLFLGSSCIYPKLAPQPMKEEHLLTGLLEPTNEPYAVAKIAGIKMCDAYNRQYGTRFMAVMPTNLYGPNDNFDLENSHVLPALIRKFHLARLAEIGDWNSIEKDEALFGPIPDDLKQSLLSEKSPSTLHSHAHGVTKDGQSSTLSPQHSALSSKNSSVSIWGTGSPRREFMHVDDMANACVFVMNLDEKIAASELLDDSKPCFVNVGTGTDSTIRELAQIIQRSVGFDGKLVFDSSKPDGTPRKLLDVSRLTALGWRPTISLMQGIKDTYRWYISPQQN